jgi:hypothetical protein
MTDEVYDKTKGHAVTQAQSDAQKELNDIAIAIGSNRFLDLPDGGSVSLAEQVTRMRQALEKAEAAQSNAEPVAADYIPIGGAGNGA